jgi:hypothetical protein
MERTVCAPNRLQLALAQCLRRQGKLSMTDAPYIVYGTCRPNYKADKVSDGRQLAIGRYAHIGLNVHRPSRAPLLRKQKPHAASASVIWLKRSPYSQNTSTARAIPRPRFRA